MVANHGNLQSTCSYLDGFALFTIPKAGRGDASIGRAVHRAVRKHQFVISAEMTDLKNILVVPDERSLRKSGMGYGEFEDEIKELIVGTVRHKLSLQTKSKAKSGYVNDKTRRTPAAVPVTA